ncbi:MAG: hypothetical protein HQM00_17580 [Magnetococcales bacterium]|nr:hypothetical protein [Magnetococcales bacterium]
MRWTAEMVRERLEQAARVERRRPCGKVRPDGAGSSWPTKQMPIDGAICLSRPTPVEIALAEEAMDWLLLIKPEWRRVLWRKAEGAREREMELEFGVHRSVLYRRCRRGWQVIAKWLTWTNATRHELLKSFSSQDVTEKTLQHV